MIKLLKANRKSLTVLRSLNYNRMVYSKLLKANDPVIKII